MNKDKQFNFHEIRGEIPFRISTKKEKGRERERKKEKGEREERKGYTYRYKGWTILWD